MNYSSGELIEPGITHIWNQVTLNDSTIFVDYDTYVNTACMVKVDTVLYYKYLRISDVD